MPPQAGAIFLDLYFLRSAGHLDLGAIIQIARLGALKPDHLATFFCHITTRYSFTSILHARILVTTPEPTVLPPSRTAKRSFSSMPIGAWSPTSIVTLSPGITISAPPSNLGAPVTRVARQQKSRRAAVETG